MTPLSTQDPDDKQLCTAIQSGLAEDPRTARLAVDVDVMDHRVFLSGHVEDANVVRRVAQAVAQLAEVGEVVDLLDVE